MRCFFYGDFLGDLKKKYINSAVLLFAASILVKAIGAIYKIPLTAYIGATGRGYYNMAYNLYMPVHAVIMGAFPVALTHLISKYREQGNTMRVAQLKKASEIMFFFVGIAGTVLMVAAAVPYANYLASPKCVVAVLALFMLQFRFQLCGCGVHLPQQVGAFRRFLRVVKQLFARFLLILVF